MVYSRLGHRHSSMGMSSNEMLHPSLEAQSYLGTKTGGDHAAYHVRFGTLWRQGALH